MSCILTNFHLLYLHGSVDWFAQTRSYKNTFHPGRVTKLEIVRHFVFLSLSPGYLPLSELSKNLKHVHVLASPGPWPGIESRSELTKNLTASMYLIESKYIIRTKGQTELFAFFEKLAEQIFKILVSGESYGPPPGLHVFLFCLRPLWGPRVAKLVVSYVGQLISWKPA